MREMNEMRDFYKSMILEYCEVAELTGKRSEVSTDSPSIRDVLEDLDQEGTIYMYDSLHGNAAGSCKVIAGFTEKGKRVYMYNGKLIDAFRIKKPEVSSFEPIKTDALGDESK